MKKVEWHKFQDNAFIGFMRKWMFGFLFCFLFSLDSTHSLDAIYGATDLHEWKNNIRFQHKKKNKIKEKWKDKRVYLGISLKTTDDARNDGFIRVFKRNASELWRDRNSKNITCRWFFSSFSFCHMHTDRTDGRFHLVFFSFFCVSGCHK